MQNDLQHELQSSSLIFPWLIQMESTHTRLDQPVKH